MGLFKKVQLIAGGPEYEQKFWVYVTKGFTEFERLEEGADTLPRAIAIAEKFQHAGTVRIEEQLKRTVRKYPKTKPEPLA